MTESFDAETEKKILSLITQYPGIFLSKIAEVLGMKLQNVEYYLELMEKNQTIISIQKDGSQRYYLNTRNKFSDDAPQKTEEIIHDLIAKNPGLHLSKIAEILQMSKPLAVYHLLRMEKDKEIVIKKEVGFKRYYLATDAIETRDKELLALLRKEIPLKIVLFLSKKDSAQHKEILEQLDISASTLSYHLNKLVEQGVIALQPYGEEKGYAIVNKKEIVNFILRYRLNVLTDGFKDFWDDLNYTRWKGRS
jgi:predicted transcriptional regulator